MDSEKDKQRLLELYQQQYNYYKYNKLKLYYTDQGMRFDDKWYPPRHMYHKYLQFFAAGKYNKERVIFSGNRVGKSEGVCGYETALHATGDYPDWWCGHRFKSPPIILICGKTHVSVRDILQVKLFGPPGGDGTGLIPLKSIIHKSFKSGASGAIDRAQVRFKGFPDDQATQILFRTYGQDRDSVEGIEVNLLWVDEEAGMSFYNEAKMRTATTYGLCMMSFTPLEGFTETVRWVIPDGNLPQYNPELYKDDVKFALKGGI